MFAILIVICEFIKKCCKKIKDKCKNIKDKCKKIHREDDNEY